MAAGCAVPAEPTARLKLPFLDYGDAGRSSGLETTTETSDPALFVCTSTPDRIRIADCAGYANAESGFGPWPQANARGRSRESTGTPSIRRSPARLWSAAASSTATSRTSAASTTCAPGTCQTLHRLARRRPMCACHPVYSSRSRPSQRCRRRRPRPRPEARSSSARFAAGHPRGSRSRTLSAMPASIVVRLIAAASLLVTSIALLTSMGDPRPQRLTIVPAQAFVAPAVQRIRRLQIGHLLLATTITGAIALDAGAEPDVRTLHLIVRVSNAVAAALCLTAAVVHMVGWRRAPFALTPHGVQSFLRRVTWEQLDAMPTLPRRYPSGGYRGLRFAVLDVDTEFVAAAIEYYRRHPDARPMIGQADEYQRLSQAIAASNGIWDSGGPNPRCEA
jgi:hypothetical protein